MYLASMSLNHFLNLNAVTQKYAEGAPSSTFLFQVCISPRQINLLSFGEIEKVVTNQVLMTSAENSLFR